MTLRPQALVNRSNGLRPAWRLAGAVLALLCILWVSYRVYRAAITAEPARVVRSYFEAVVTDQSEQAEGFLVGTALASFKRTMANRSPAAAALESITMRWPVAGSELAIAEVAVKVHQVGGRDQGVDIQGARLHLTRTANGWQIFAVESAPLPYAGWSSNANAALDVVTEYVKNVLAGDYDRALMLLAGQARTDAEATLSYVKQAKMQTTASAIQTTVLQKQGDSVWIKAEYHVTVGDTPERPVTLLLELRHIGKSLAIVRVNNL